MNQQEIFASTQIILFNPILNKSIDTRIQYFVYLKKLIKVVKWDKRKYTKAQTRFYKEILCDKENVNVDVYNKKCFFDPSFCYLLPYDLSVMLGFHSKIIKSDKTKIIISKIISDFNLPSECASFLSSEFEAALGNSSAWENVLKSKWIKEFRPYLNLVRQNIVFMRTRPFNILVTATMSAGKSTLINSLVGKNISLMQNMACTSKIHTIISKPIEDGITSEYDHDFVIGASSDDLLCDNQENTSYKITVGTFFHGELGGKRIILYDSPGVNSSENEEHTEISRRMIKSRKYKLMIYVLNATQLGTTDEEQHLEIVRQRLGNIRIIFVMNKSDQLISEDDNFLDSIESQRNFLISKGFKDPLICPVSSRAAYLVKKSKIQELSKMERREMENFMDKFELERLSDYYENNLGCPHISSDNEEDMLFVNCGFANFEKLITNLYDGGNENGTGLC